MKLRVSRGSHTWLWLMGGFVVAVLVGGSVVWGMAARSDTRPGGVYQHHRSDPFLAGKRTSLTQASRLVGFTVPRPAQTFLVRDTRMRQRWSVGQVWVSPGSREVAVFLDGRKIEILMTPVPSYRKDAVKFFKSFIATKTARMHETKVQSRPALVIMPRTDFRHSNPACVEFYRNGIDITIYSSVVSPRALETLAYSIR